VHVLREGPGFRCCRAGAKLAAIAEHRNAACAALRIAETQARYPAGDEATAERYRAAREALEGSGEKGPGRG
jgi:regulator of protease activity HflC (stomatin/prohibitin superfamily)